MGTRGTPATPADGLLPVLLTGKAGRVGAARLPAPNVPEQTSAKAQQSAG